MDDIQQKTVKEREKYQNISQNKKAVSAIPQFHINDKYVLNREDASYTLGLEVQMAIDNVLVQVMKKICHSYLCSIRFLWLWFIRE